MIETTRDEIITSANNTIYTIKLDIVKLDNNVPINRKIFNEIPANLEGRYHSHTGKEQNIVHYEQYVSNNLWFNYGKYHIRYNHVIFKKGKPDNLIFANISPLSLYDLHILG